MKKIAVTALLILAGCGSHYVIPATATQPQRIGSSGYTASGCIANLAEQARENNCDLTNTQVDTSGVIAGALLFPFVKGYACTADATPRR